MKLGAASGEITSPYRQLQIRQVFSAHQSLLLCSNEVASILFCIFPFIFFRSTSTIKYLSNFLMLFIMHYIKYKISYNIFALMINKEKLIDYFIRLRFSSSANFSVVLEIVNQTQDQDLLILIFFLQYGVKFFVLTSFKDTCSIEILPKVQKSKRGNF